jgi:predicted transposase YbfD/YdcC
MGHGRFSLMDFLDEIDDPRAESNGTLYDFRELLVIAICASLCDMDTCEDFALWAHARQPWLKRFLTLKNGTPSSATFYRLFRALDPKQFEAFFRRWVGQIVPAAALPGQLAIDGKTIRGSADGAQRPAHIVSAFSTELGIVFGQERVDQKSNEITAIPELLEALYVQGFLVSIDAPKEVALGRAMGCQKEIARKIIDKGGDYLLMVKGNQPGLLAQVSEAFVTEQRAQMPRFEHIEKSHGRLVTQLTWTAPAALAGVDTREWPNCTTIAMVASLRQVSGKTSDLEQRYYISSRDLAPEAMAKAVRAHWGVENKLHWMLDVNFSEDACTVKKDNAPEILSSIRRVVINMLSLDTTQPEFAKKKLSKRQKRKFANLEESIMRSILGIQSL